METAAQGDLAYFDDEGIITQPGSMASITPEVAPPGAWLEVVFSPDGAQVGTRVALSDALVLIGRDFDGHGLAIDDRRLSRVHARVTFDGRAGGYRLGDAHSRNGSYVNGRSVQTAIFQEGDVVRIGDTVLVFQQRDLMAALRARTASLAPTDLTVLLRGETGTGKELVAGAIHDASGRAGAFVAVNCASIPLNLVGTELFGHTRNAFTGALAPRKGLVRAAEGGTLFLDEVGDCPLEIQAALLRVLQQKAVRPIGAEAELPVDVRVIAATHANLERAVESLGFRADLYARLTQACVSLPPLRERRTDVLALARTFAEEAGIAFRLTADAAEALLSWHWPFNIRELQSLVRSFAALASERPALDLAFLSESRPDIAASVVERRTVSRVSELPAPQAPSDRQRLRALLEAHGGNVSAVAHVLGKPRAQIYRWMTAMGLSAGRFRK